MYVRTTFSFFLFWTPLRPPTEWWYSRSTYCVYLQVASGVIKLSQPNLFCVKSFWTGGTPHFFLSPEPFDWSSVYDLFAFEMRWGGPKIILKLPPRGLETPHQLLEFNTSFQTVIVISLRLLEIVQLWSSEKHREAKEVRKRTENNFNLCQWKQLLWGRRSKEAIYLVIFVKCITSSDRKGSFETEPA